MEKDGYRRKEYLEEIKDIKVEDILYVDESEIDKNIIKETAWIKKGNNIIQEVSGKKHSRTTIIAGLNLKDDIIAPIYFKGNTNTEIFINTHSELQTEFTDLLKNILNNNNVSCSAVHPFTCPSEPMMFFSSYERRVDDIIDYYKYYFETMNKFGAKILVFHGNKRIHPAPEELYFERFGRLAMTAEEFGVIAAQENVERCQSNSLEFMPLYFSSVSGKCDPMSPWAIAPKRASIMAWIRASPSECPLRPKEFGITTPPITSGLPSSKRWESYPKPMRIILNLHLILRAIP